jgi:branched-chain amino acid transport system ATP-binding protein
VDFSISESEMVGLIGPNGAGKTTLFNVITGIMRPTHGRVFFKKLEITNFPPHKVCQVGVARTFQASRVFMGLTAVENLKLAQAFGKSHKKSADLDIEQLLSFVHLTEKRNVHAKKLSLLERKLLEIAMALATNPCIILLDEPCAGLIVQEINQITEVIEKIRSNLGITIFWIEHVLSAVMKFADRIIVLCEGKKIAEGRPTEIASNKEVLEAYMGGE